MRKHQHDHLLQQQSDPGLCVRPELWFDPARFRFHGIHLGMREYGPGQLYAYLSSQFSDTDPDIDRTSLFSRVTYRNSAACSLANRASASAIFSGEVKRRRFGSSRFTWQE
jgi:hypothetical protein